MSDRTWTPGGAATTLGVIEGIVIDNKDPEGIGRVLVKFPWLPNETQSAWARMSTPMAGKDMGIVIYPEVNDEVLIDFVNGNVHEPVILGSLYNGKDIPPFDNADGENNLRIFVSRSGHRIEIDDTDGAEKITITDTSGGLIVEMDSANEAINITSSKDITIKCDNNFTLEAKEVEVKSGSDMKLDAGSNFEAGAGSKATVEAGSQVNVTGATINLN